MTSTEHQTVGFETESKYWLRLVGYSGVLGAQSQVDWQRKRYAIDGDPSVYNGSRPEPHWRALCARARPPSVSGAAADGLCGGETSVEVGRSAEAAG